MRIFTDTEFTHLPRTGRSALLWVGLCDDAGDTFSAVNADVDLADRYAFVRARVLPKIPTGETRQDTAALASAVRHLCDVTEMWAWQPSIAGIASYGFDPADAAAQHTRYTDWHLHPLRPLTGETMPPWQHCLDLHRLADDAPAPLPASPHAHHPRYDGACSRQVYLAATADRLEEPQ